MSTTTNNSLLHRTVRLPGQLGALLLTACGGSAASAASACVEQYVGRLDTLLAVDDFAGILGVDAATVTTATPQPGRVVYSWQGERQRTLGAGDVEIAVPLPSKAVLANVNSYGDDVGSPVEYFKTRHETPTDAEVAKLRATVVQRVKANADISRAAQKMVIKMAIVMINKEKMRYEPVEGVADAAAWKPSSSTLYVLTGRTHFALTALVTDQRGDNKKLATKLAEKVLADCAQ